MSWLNIVAAYHLPERLLKGRNSIRSGKVQWSQKISCLCNLVAWAHSKRRIALILFFFFQCCGIKTFRCCQVVKKGFIYCLFLLCPGNEYLIIFFFFFTSQLLAGTSPVCTFTY